MFSGLTSDHAALERQMHAGDAPVLTRHSGLRDLDVPAAVEPAENAPAEGDILEESSLDPGNALLLAVDQDHRLHPLQYLRLVIGRRKRRIRRTLQAQVAIVLGGARHSRSERHREGQGSGAGCAPDRLAASCFFRASSPGSSRRLMRSSSCRRSGGSVPGH